MCWHLNWKYVCVNTDDIEDGFEINIICNNCDELLARRYEFISVNYTKPANHQWYAKYIHIPNIRDYISLYDIYRFRSYGKDYQIK